MESANAASIRCDRQVVLRTIAIYPYCGQRKFSGQTDSVSGDAGRAMRDGRCGTGDAGRATTSLSISLAQFWQSQIPFSALLRCSGVSPASNLGPPAEALVIWAATPRLTALDGSSCGPAVSAWQSGFEHVVDTRKARTRLTSAEKSSLIWLRDSLDGFVGAVWVSRDFVHETLC
jgi:hypothetical protein